MQHHAAEKAQTQADAAAYQQMQEQAAMEQAAQQAADAAPAAAPAADPVAQLQELAKLKEQGVLTEEEFAAQKARILGG
jgi:hypothetical protein